MRAKTFNRAGVSGVPSPVNSIGNRQRALVQAAYYASLWLCALLQCAIEPDYINIACALISAVAGTAVAAYVLGTRPFGSLPLSTFAVLGVNVVTTSGALWFQTLGWRAVTFNLDVPLQTFSIGAIFSIACVATHAAYARMGMVRSARLWLSGAVYRPLGLFKVPSANLLWAMGAVGVVAMWLSGTSEARQTMEFGDVSGKFGEALTPFAVAPFLIPLAAMMSRQDQQYTRKVNWWALAAYFAVIVIVAMARNSRSTFASILVIVGLGVMLAVITGQVRVNGRSALLAAISAVGLLAVSPILSDVSTAILINRIVRNEVSATNLVSSTIETAGNKDLIENFNAKRRIITSGYNEIYIESEFLSRFVYVKFLDLNLKHSAGLTDSQVATAREAFVERMLANFPTPILHAVDVNIDKDSLQYSGGDLYRSLSSSRTLQGFTVGSPIADGMVIFGPLFWPFCFGLFVVAFLLIDALSHPLSANGFPVSPVALISLPQIFIYVFLKDSIAILLGWFVRGYWQTILLYLFLFYALGAFDRFARTGSAGVKAKVGNSAMEPRNSNVGSR